MAAGCLGKRNELDFLEALVTVWVAVIVDVTDAKAECKAATDREDEAKEPRPMEVNCWRSSKSNPSPKPMACMRSEGNSSNIFCAACSIWVPSAGLPSLKIRRCGVPKDVWTARRSQVATFSPSTKWVPRLATKPLQSWVTSSFASPAVLRVKCTLLVSLKEIKENLAEEEGGRCLVRRTWGDRLSATNDSGDLYQLRDTGAVTEWGQFLRCLQGGLQWMNEQEKESDFQPGTYATKQGVWASFCNNRSINITNLPVVPHKAVAKVSKIGNL